MGGPGNPVPDKILKKINDSWKELFEGLQDLSEWLEEQGHGPNPGKRPCPEVPLFRREAG